MGVFFNVSHLNRVVVFIGLIYLGLLGVLFLIIQLKCMGVFQPLVISVLFLLICVQSQPAKALFYWTHAQAIRIARVQEKTALVFLSLSYVLVNTIMISIFIMICK